MLRVTTTVGLGAGWLTERLQEFLELYPDIQLQLILANEELDLTMRQADCAIRLRQPQQPDLIQRRLFTVHFHLYAAPTYIKRTASRRSIEDLEATASSPSASRCRRICSELQLAGDRRPAARQPARACGQDQQHLRHEERGHPRDRDRDASQLHDRAGRRARAASARRARCRASRATSSIRPSSESSRACTFSAISC